MLALGGGNGGGARPGDPEESSGGEGQVIETIPRVCLGQVVEQGEVGGIEGVGQAMPELGEPVPGVPRDRLARVAAPDVDGLGAEYLVVDVVKRVGPVHERLPSGPGGRGLTAVLQPEQFSVLVGGDETRDATRGEVQELRRENERLKQLVAEVSLDNMVLKKSLL